MAKVALKKTILEQTFDTKSIFSIDNFAIKSQNRRCRRFASQGWVVRLLLFLFFNT